MPNFGQPAAQRQAERALRASRNSYINTFRDEETMLRWLWEDPARVWVTFYYHFHYAKKISYPCVRGMDSDDGTRIAYCLGCTWPADESLTEEERAKDGDWRVRKANYGIAAPALTLKTVDGEAKEYLDIYQLGVTLYDSLKVMYRENGTVTARDIKVIRTDDGKTKYTAVEKGDAFPRKYVVELRELLRECAPGMSAEQGTPEYKTAWDRWRAGNTELGIPDVNVILERKYREAAETYGVSAEELADRNQAMIAAGHTTGAVISDLKAKAHAAKASAGVTPAATQPTQQPTQQAAQATQATIVDTDLPLEELDLPAKAYNTLMGADITSIGRLIAWSGTSLVELGLEERYLTPIRVALAGRNLELADEPGAAPPAAGQPDPVIAAQLAATAPDATVHQLPAPAAAAMAAAKAQAEAVPAATNGATALHPDGTQNFDAWDTPDIRDWLKENRVEFPDKAPRSVLIGLANRKVIGF